MHKPLFIALAIAAAGAHAATNGDVKIKAGEAHFRMMDTNKDGQISPDEHAAGARWMFDTMDTNKDGKVTAEEMDAAHDARTQRKGELTSAQKIKVVDADGDGALSAEEHMKGARAMFERMDTDKSGGLSSAELQAGHKKMLEKAR